MALLDGSGRDQPRDDRRQKKRSIPEQLISVIYYDGLAGSGKAGKTIERLTSPGGEMHMSNQ
jgi:hypothetical protein